MPLRFALLGVCCLALAHSAHAQGHALVLSDSGYIDLGDPGDAFDFSEDGRTFALWVRHADSLGYHAKLLDKYTNKLVNDDAPLEQMSGNVWGWSFFNHLYVGTVGSLATPSPDAIRDGEYATSGGAGLSPIDDAQWHFVALVQDGQRVLLYHDGRLDAGYDLSYPIAAYANEARLFLGWDGDDIIYLSSEVDDLSIWNRPLGAPEIRALMYAPPEPSALGLAAHWTFDDIGSDGHVPDASPNGYHARAHHASLTPSTRPTAPPWMERWWFQALIGLAGLALFSGVLRAYGWRTEQKRRHLEIVVDERTSELSDALATVEQQAAALRTLDEDKNRFVANISHEFRTPLTLALGLLGDLLGGRGGALSDAQHADLTQIAENNRRLLRLVNQLLDVARLDAQALTLRIRPADLAEQIGGVAEAFVPLAERKGVRFERAIPANCSAWADPDPIELIVTNLLSNAFKFTPAGGTIRLALSQAEGFAELTVQDTGIGIAHEHLPHIFDRFYQADESHEHVGTGIGLAALKEVVDLYGGTVRAESVLGIGTRFVVQLPTAREAFERNAQASLVDEPETTAATALAVPLAATSPDVPPAISDEDDDRTTVLIVDDSADIRAFVRRHLSPHYHIREAADGQDALDSARAHLPDLILSDVMMPRMDGYGLVKALREDPELDFIPIILLTARAATPDQLAGLELGANDYLTKPFDVDELLLRVRNTIQHQQRLRQRLHADAPPAPHAPQHAAAARDDSDDAAFLEEMAKVIAAHLSDTAFNVEALAGALSVDRSQLYRRVQVATGETPSALLRTHRLERAAVLLREDAGNVGEVAFAVGFQSASYFSKRFREHFGTSPKTYVARG